MHCTDPTTQVARKAHVCQSCGQIIAAGGVYLRWRCYDSGDAGTVKMHPECHDMHNAEAEGAWEFTPYSYERPNTVRPSSVSVTQF